MRQSGWLKKAGVAVLAIATTVLPSVSYAATNVKYPGFLDSIQWKGDFRLRYEIFDRKTASAVDRQRARYRLRYGATAKMQDYTVGFRLASGESAPGDQVSTNQSFTANASKKPITIDMAFASWKAKDWLKLIGGKMENPVKRLYSSDLVFDGDYTPEGIAEQFNAAPSDTLSLYANFGQFFLNEVSGSSNDPMLFANQIGASFRLTDDVTSGLALGLHHFKGVSGLTTNATKLSSLSTLNGNTRVTGAPAGTTAALSSEFTVMDLSAKVETALLGAPFLIGGDFIKNLTVTQDKSNDSGYQFGFQVGRAKAAKTWEFAYYYKLSENNATVADLADSDFGVAGGTNAKGHILWLAYAPKDFINLKAKMLHVLPEDPARGTGNSETTRYQFDFQFLF